MAKSLKKRNLRRSSLSRMRRNKARALESLKERQKKYGIPNPRRAAEFRAERKRKNRGY